MSRKTLKKIRAVSRAMTAVAFLCLFGFVGGMETGGSVAVGVIGSVLSLAAMWLFAYIGGLFN